MADGTAPGPFINGIALSEQFYWRLVRPILERRFPDLAHAAALINTGSEVLGFDDLMSTDHHWGPRVLLFVEEDTYPHVKEQVDHYLRSELPTEFLGYPTNFTEPDPNDGGVQKMRPIERGPVNHRVELHTMRGFFEETIGHNIDRPLEPADWLTLPEQFLRIIATGPIFFDNIGLRELRRRFSYYPDDVWFYLLAAGWTRIGQEEHLMGRAGWVGDEIGSTLIAARLVRDVMRLCFLMERTYAPYPKWFGTAFLKLDCVGDLWQTLQAALRAATWQERERQLIQAYEFLAQQHNSLGLTAPLPEKVMAFHGRPFHSIAMHGFADALLAKIVDPAVRLVAERPPIGQIDQFSDSTDLLSKIVWRPTLRQLYK